MSVKLPEIVNKSEVVLKDESVVQQEVKKQQLEYIIREEDIRVPPQEIIKKLDRLIKAYKIAMVEEVTREK